MKKQSAVQWLVEQVNSDCLNSAFIRPELVEQAKEMERVEHGITWDKGIEAHEKRGYNLSRSICDFDDYYNQTYRK